MEVLMPKSLLSVIVSGNIPTPRQPQRLQDPNSWCTPSCPQCGVRKG